MSWFCRGTHHNDNKNNDNDSSCGHCFHLDCLEKWRKTRGTCPLCQKEWDMLKVEVIPGYENELNNTWNKRYLDIRRLVVYNISKTCKISANIFFHFQFYLLSCATCVNRKFASKKLTPLKNSFQPSCLPTLVYNNL